MAMTGKRSTLITETKAPKSLAIQVKITPGCKQYDDPWMPALSILACNSFVKRILAILDLEYAILAEYPLLMLISPKSMQLSFLLKKPAPRCAVEATLMILGLSAAFIRLQRRQVRQKWPKWFTPIVISKPSFVNLLSLETKPALFMRTSILLQDFLIFELNSQTDFLSPKSRGKNKRLHLGIFSITYLSTASDLILSLAPKITVQLLPAKTQTVSLPMPALPPVITMTLPVKSLLPLQTPPLKYNFKTTSKTIAPITIEAEQRWQLDIQFSIILLSLIYSIKS